MSIALLARARQVGTVNQWADVAVEYSEDWLHYGCEFYYGGSEEQMADKTIGNILGELAGAASLCWTPKPTGEFDAPRAAGFVSEAELAIAALIEDKTEELRMQLVACGMAAVSNTDKSRAALERMIKESPLHLRTGSFNDVWDAVDREMKLRDRCAELETALNEKRG